MEANLRGFELRYNISGRDEDGLIPEGATNVLVQYKENGEPYSIFYSKEHVRSSDIDVLKRNQEEIEDMNDRELTPEEVGRVSGLLRKLSNFSIQGILCTEADNALPSYRGDGIIG